MTKIYYKSDFDFILNLTDCDGNQIGWPKGEWEVMFWMRGNKARIYRAGVGSDGQPYGCYNDNDRIHIVMDSHSLGIGQLMCEVRLNRSESHYPDGVKSHVFAADLDIELTNEKGHCGCENMTATAYLPITTAEVFGDTIDKINARLEDILGGKVGVITLPEVQPSAAKSVGVVNGPAILQRGMMPLGAREGVIYRNLGYIKLGTIGGGETKTYDLSGVDMNLITDVYLCGNDDNFQSSINYNQKFVTIYNHGDRTSARLEIHTRVCEFLMRKDGVIQACDNGFRPIEPVLPSPIIVPLIPNTLEGYLDGIQRSHPNYKLEAWKKRRSFMDDDNNRKWKWSRIFPSESACGIVRVRWINRRGLKSAWSVFSFCCHQIAPLS